MDPNQDIGVRLVAVDPLEEMEAYDKLPSLLREVVNFSPNVKWSAIKVLEGFKKHKELCFFRSEEDCAKDLVEFLKQRDFEAGEIIRENKSNQPRAK